MVSSSEAFENQSDRESLDGTPDSLQQSSISLARHSNPSRVALGFSFVGAFVVAALGFLVAGHYLVGAPRSLSFFDEAVERSGESLFSDALVVSAPGIYKRVATREELNPTGGSDFLVFVWFRLKRVPVTGESMSLVGKFDAQRPSKPGFAISLEGAPDGVRPRVYWNNDSGQGRWYSFTSRTIRRKEWYLLGISYSRDTFLSARLLEVGGKDEGSLLGGHRVEPSFVAASQADLVLGSYGSSRFRGQIGPFGILRGGRFDGEIPQYLSKMSASPQDVPTVIPLSLIQLWASPLVDRGPHHLALDNVAAPPAKKELVPSTASPKPSPKLSSAKRVKKGGKRKSGLSGKR
jgi:hypothetical protein